METIYFPYTALFVSKHWRNVALATPEVWTSVFIRNSQHDTRKIKSKLSVHLEKAGSLPLNLLYFLDGDSLAYRGGVKMDAPRMKRLRWRKITIGVSAQFNPRIHVWHTLIDLARTQHEDTFQELEVIGNPSTNNRVQLSIYDDLRWKVKMVSFISLRKLHCNAIEFKPATASNPLVLPNLRELRLENISNQESLNMLQFAKLPALSCLGIQFVLGATLPSSVHPPDPETVAVKSFQAPSLRHLVILNAPDPTIISNLLSTIPLLETLVICSRVGAEFVNLSTLLKLSICPDLRTLGLCDLPFEYMDDTVFIERVVKARIPTLRRIVLEQDFSPPPTHEEDVWSELRKRVQVESWTRDSFELGQVFDRLAGLENY